jgi:hypothetical protein
MILLKKRPHLFLEIPLAVMRLLLRDVSNQRTGIRRPNGERTVPTLPPKCVNALNLHPFGRRNLYFFNKLRNALRRMHPHRQMHMVCNTADPETIALLIANDGSKIGMQTISHTILQQRTTILRTENDMNQQKTQRLGHRKNYRSTLQRLMVSFVTLSMTLLIFFATGCDSQPPRDPTVESVSKPGGIIIHAKVADPNLEYITSFLIAETKDPSHKALAYEGNHPMRAMLIAVHEGNNHDDIHDEANGFDQFLLQPPESSNGGFTILSGTQYNAKACTSRGRCSSMTFTLGERP